ncbi:MULTISPECIES: sensor histidine kinase [Streptomyces]|uniref:histidine kinase n=1 Tax=Streptomyces spororaveus TaxID=284039 RepID=A0ABQ3T590_9ACTN|nr:MULTISPECIES: sensor histidine kinase [Streptomyces]MCM9076653.1 sensor histidine kinase [Streptomyces spororaveus]MCX5308689.1 sensor histidine kinase [Streptomyces sp. NBC_00160]GHI75546.1 ATPase [Streptomyces spororaveus]
MHAGSGVLDRLGGRYRPLLVDLLLALGYVGAGLLLGREQPPAGWRPVDGPGAVLTALVGLVMVARRIAPVAVFGAAAVLWILFIACGYWPVVNSMPALLGLYTVAATRRPRTALVCAAVVAGVWVYAGVGNLDNSSMPTVLAQAVLFPAVVFVVGRGSAALAERNRQFAELTLQLRRQQEERALRALTEERVRIARELHDVVAHHMSVISLQAGMASYVFTTDPAASRQALDTIADTSREALEEMRRMLVLLRVGQEGPPEDGTAYAPAPGLDLLDRLLERVRGAGVEVTMEVAGSPTRLPQGMALCVYRVVQEALTNVLKHAGPTRAAVTIRYERRTVVVCVTDEGDGNFRPNQGMSPGHGLIGMRERAKIYGGSVTAGPRALGGFEVRLTLPAPTLSDRRGGLPAPGTGDVPFR